MGTDLRRALRTLMRGPRFATVAAGSMGLGIAAATAIFSFVHGILLAPLPFPDSERLVAIQEYVHGREVGGNPQRLIDWLAAPSIASVTGYYGENFTLESGGLPERVHGLRVFGEFQRTFNVQPARGRVFNAQEQVGRGSAVALITDALWRSRFGADASAVGRTIRLNGASCEIIGVLPRGTRLEDSEIISPEPSPDYSRRARFLMQVARLKPGASLGSAQHEVDTVTSRLLMQYPDTDGDMAARVSSLRDELANDARTPLLLLMGAVGFIVLMASINVANLFLSRLAARAPELAVRRALGANRWQLLRLLFLESGVVAVAGGVLGLFGAVWGMDALRAVAPPELPRLDEVRLDWTVAAFAGALTLACALVSGLLPAWRNSSVSLGLKDGSRGSASRHRAQQFLVAGQVALSLAMAVGGGLLLRSLWNLEHRPIGFSPERLLTFRLSLPWQTEPEKLAMLYDNVLDRMKALPGVADAALTDRLPLDGDSQSGDVEIAGKPVEQLHGGAKLSLRAASTNFHEVMRVPLLAGRYLEPGDRAQQRAVINEAAAHAYFAGENPLGRRIGIRSSRTPARPETLYEIVGVTGNLPDRSAERQAEPAMYVPFNRTFWPLAQFVVRTRVEPAAMAEGVRRAVAEVDSSRAVELVQTMDTYLGSRNSTAKLETWMVGLFAAAAMLLAAIGIFGLVSGWVTERRFEIGIRMALGAEPLAVLRETFTTPLRQVACGVAAGFALAAVLSRTFEKSLYKVTGADVPTYVAAGILLLFVAFGSAWWPARRAITLDPALLLRRE